MGKKAKSILTTRLFCLIFLSLVFFLGVGIILAADNSLSFEKRLECEKAIEKIYFNHRIWPGNVNSKPLFEIAVPESVLLKNAEDAIKKSIALEFYWKSPITGEQLQAEIDRIAKNTKNPEVLKEIWDALDNNPYLVAECLARPLLADRLIRNYYAYDDRFHGGLRSLAQNELNKISDPAQMKHMQGEYLETVFAKSKDDMKENIYGEIILNEAEWANFIKKIDKKGFHINEISSLREDENRFYSTAILEKSENRIRIATIQWNQGAV